MSLTLETKSINTYFTAQWTATPYGLPDHPFTPPMGLDGKPAPSVRMTIINGDVMQGSIGRVQNVFNNMGVLSIQLFTDGALGRASWTTHAENLITLFHGKTLDAAGAVITSGAQTALVRFSPPEAGASRHPHIAATTDDPPFRVTTINCPFTRYQLR